MGCETIRRDNVVACALAANVATKAQRYTLESLEGRQRSASVLLPSNPGVAVTGALPIEPGVTDRSVLWSATLSQELEIGGQRGARLDVVAAEKKAQTARLSATTRDAAADALVLYFDAVAASDQAKLSSELARLAQVLAAASRARAQTGAGTGVEAQLAAASSARLLQEKLTSEERLTTRTAALASALGSDPAKSAIRIEGDLKPLEVSTGAPVVDKAVEQRAEVAAARADAEAQEGRASLYRRLRIPNPTLSFFVRNDWIGERSAGIGLTLPIPLPSPIGRTYAGEIQETTALAARAETEAEGVKRAVRLEVSKAIATLNARKSAVELYPPDQVRETTQTLRNIADEVEAGRLPVREAVFTQQALIDYLLASIEARRQLCVASVEVARASGIALERGVP